MRQIAVVTDYLELIAALRARADELQISREALDDITGLQSGYTGKLLAPVPLRALGRTSLGPMLTAMGLKIIVVEDLAALEKIRKRISKRRNASVAMLPHKSQKKRSVWKGCSEWSRLMNARRNAKLTDKQRSDSARRAARLRWTKVRRAKSPSNALREPSAS